jgi:TRAP-type C4-dicarboxylate transport system substrate-binding protein
MKTLLLKKNMIVAAVISMIAVGSMPVSAGNAGTAAGRPVEIRLATLALRGTSPHLAIEQMAQEWQRLSGGRVRVVVYPDYHQGEAAMVDKMGVRGLDAAVMANVGLSKIDEGITCLVRLPMGFRSLKEVDYVQEKNVEERVRAPVRVGYRLGADLLQTTRPLA